MRLYRRLLVRRLDVVSLLLAGISITQMSFCWRPVRLLSVGGTATHTLMGFADGVDHNVTKRVW